MICNANELSPDQRSALETLFDPATVSSQRKIEIANELKIYFAEVDAARKPVSDAEAEDILTEAMRSVRPGDPEQ